MVYTELAPRRQQFHVAPAMPSAVSDITSVDIFKKTRYKKLVTHVESRASAVSLLKRAENSAIKAIINQSMSEPVWPSGKALGWQVERTSVRYRFCCPFSSKRLWFVDTVLWTLSVTSY